MRATFAEMRERLADLDRLDAGRKVFASDAHQYRLNPPLPQKDIERVEALIGGQLPDQYRRFVAEFADGGAGPEYGILPLARLLKPDYKRSWLASHARPFLAPATVAAMREVGYSAPGVLMVSEIGCGAHYWLVVSGPQRGFVWAQNPDAEWSPVLADESHVPAYSEEAGTDPIFAALLGSPDSQRLEFVDWYAKWLDESLRAAQQPPRR